MSKVLIDRAVVVQALELLAKQRCDSKHEQDCSVCATEEALRTALETNHEVASAKVEQPAEPVAQGWRPIETAPKDSTSVLIYCPNSERMPVCEAWWAIAYEGDYGGHWQTPMGPNGRGYTILPTSPTHWMPLPEAPNAAPEAPQPAKPAEQEPVAWHKFLRRIEWSDWRYDRFGDSQAHCPDCENQREDGHAEGCELASMLAAAPEAPQPAKRETLTDEELDVADMTATQVANQNQGGTQTSWRKAYLRAFAGAIEAAHGIGGQV